MIGGRLQAALMPDYTFSAPHAAPTRLEKVAWPAEGVTLPAM